MITKKILLPVVLGGVCALAAAACGSGSGSGHSGGSSSDAKTVLVCNVTDLSGVQQPYGSTDDDGGVVAADMINAAGGIKSLHGAKLVVKKFDTQSNPDLGTTEATKAVGAGCKAVWGGEITDTVLAGTAVTHRANVPWLDIGGIGIEVSQRGFNNTFQLDTTTGIARAYYQFMKYISSKTHLTNPTVGLAVSETTYGQDFYSGWNALNKNGPFKVVTNVSYPLSTTDFSSIADRMVSKHPDFLFDMGYPADGIALGRIFKDTFHPTAKAFLSTADGTLAIQQIGAAANGQAFEDNEPPTTNASLAAFNTAYKAKIGSAPSIEAWFGYTAVEMMAAAMEKTGTTSGTAMASALHGLSFSAADGNIFPGAPLVFASTGEMTTQPFFWQQAQKGKLVVVYPLSLARASLAPYSG